MSLWHNRIDVNCLFVLPSLQAILHITVEKCCGYNSILIGLNPLHQTNWYLDKEDWTLLLSVVHKMTFRRAIHYLLLLWYDGVYNTKYHRWPGHTHLSAIWLLKLFGWYYGGSTSSKAILCAQSYMVCVIGLLSSVRIPWGTLAPWLLWNCDWNWRQFEEPKERQPLHDFRPFCWRNVYRGHLVQLLFLAAGYYQ